MRDGKKVASREFAYKWERVLHQIFALGTRSARQACDFGATIGGNRSFAAIGCNYMTKVVVA
jgi:hypothetical protein